MAGIHIYVFHRDGSFLNYFVVKTSSGTTVYGETTNEGLLVTDSSIILGLYMTAGWKMRILIFR